MNDYVALPLRSLCIAVHRNVAMVDSSLLLVLSEKVYEVFREIAGFHSSFDYADERLRC